MKFTKLELELMKYAMYDLLHKNHFREMSEKIINKIDKYVNKLN